MYSVFMRTTLTLADDVHQLASAYAQARGITLGAAVGELLRKAQAAVPAAPAKVRRSTNGIPVFPRRGRTLTSARVKEALEDEVE